MLLEKQHTEVQHIARRYAMQMRRNSQHYCDVHATLRCTDIT